MTLIVLFVSCPFSSSNKIFNLTYDSVTYSWSWLNTDLGKYWPTWERYCPWLLFIVMAKQACTRNCLYWNLNGKCEYEGISNIHGIYIISPIFLPDITLGLKTWSNRLVINSLVPLQRLDDWSLLCISIIGRPIFILN